MRLVDLKPELKASRIDGARELHFLCPVCQRQRISVTLHMAECTVVNTPPTAYSEGKPIPVKVWQTNGWDFPSMSLSPSINREGLDGKKCRGWHGHITNGQIVGGI